MTFLGYGSIKGWNQDRTAFFAAVNDSIGWEDVFWAYNLLADTFIHQFPDPTDQLDQGRSETAIGWVSDGTHLLYASRHLTYLPARALTSTVTFGPRQIYIVDNFGLDDRILIDDPTHSYFLRGWDGEQLIMQRVPYEPFSVADGPVDWNALECPLYGEECSDSEYFLLDLGALAHLTTTGWGCQCALSLQPRLPFPDLERCSYLQSRPNR